MGFYRQKYGSSERYRNRHKGFGLCFTLVAAILLKIESQGVAKLRVNKVFDVSLIIWKYLFVKLSAVERKDE